MNVRDSATVGHLRELAAARGLVRIIVLAVLLVATQITVTVPNPASLGSGKSLPLAEVPLALSALWLIGSWLRHRDVRLTTDDRVLAVGVVAFTVLLVVVTVLKAVLEHRHAVSTTALENLWAGVTFYFLFRRGWFTTHHVVMATHALLVYAEVTALFRVVTQHSTLRLSAPLTNANMYVGLALLVLPYLVYYAVTAASRALLWWTLGQMATIVAFVALSGSRFGGVALVTELVLIFLLLYRRPWGTRFLHAGLSALICFAVIGVVVTASPETADDFKRTINVGSALSGQSVPSAGEEQTSPKAWSELPRVMAGVPGHWPTDPSKVDRGDPDVDVWTPDRSLRPRLWPRAFHVISEHWALGTGRPVIFYYGYGYETPHSIALDPVVSMGIFGALVLWALLLWVPIRALAQVRRSRHAVALLLGAVFLLACSLFQPLIDSVLVLGLLYWGLFAVALQRAALGPHDLSAESPRRERHQPLSEARPEPR